MKKQPSAFGIKFPKDKKEYENRLSLKNRSSSIENVSFELKPGYRPSAFDIPLPKSQKESQERLSL